MMRHRLSLSDVMPTRQRQRSWQRAGFTLRSVMLLVLAPATVLLLASLLSVENSGDNERLTGNERTCNVQHRVFGHAQQSNSPEPESYFGNHVVPVLDRRCGNCHGIATSDASQSVAGDESGQLLRWQVDSSGRITRQMGQLQAYRQCRKHLTTRTKKGPSNRVRVPTLASPLVRAPLASSLSGATHPEVFASLEDPDLITVQDWVDMEFASWPNVSPDVAGQAEQFFAEEVVPILSRKTCFASNCHGPRAFNDLRLDPGIPALPGRFTSDIQRANRAAMLGTNSRLVSLSGDIGQSKQLLKNIPIEQGGILHKGGNNFFDKGDADYQVLLHWLQLEKDEAEQRTGTRLGVMRGIVFVRRPCDTPERFFEDSEFLGGGDLIWHVDGKEVNLTAHLHPDGPADIRAPDVSYDGKRVVFALRPAAVNPFNLWEIELDTRVARQLTFSTQGDVHFLDPLYVPDPDDQAGSDLQQECLVCVSNREGDWCASSPEALLGEAEGGTTDKIIDEQRVERAETFVGQVLHVIAGANAGQVRRIVRYVPGELTVDSPFGHPCDASTHYYIDTPPRMASRYSAFRMRLAKPGDEQQVFANTLRQMTFTASQIRRPSLRSTGEIMMTALRTGWQNDKPLFNAALFRTHPDGSNFHIHNGSRSGVPIFADDRELPNGLEIRIGRSADSWWGGAILLSDHQFGPTIEPWNPADNLDHPYRHGGPEHALHRFLPGWISLDPAVELAGISSGGTYRDPYPLPDGSVLVSHATGPVDLYDRHAAPNFDLLRLIPDPSFQSADGLREGKFRSEVVIGGPMSELWPRPVVIRLKESVHKVLKSQDNLFGPPARVDGFVGYRATTPSVLKMFDLLLIDVFFQQIAPVGHRHFAMERCPNCDQQNADIDQVTHARVIGAHPQRRDDVGPPRSYIIAEVPLAQDGSFYVQLPSGVAWDIQALNAYGMAVHAPHRWLYCQPGEEHTLSIPRALYAQACSGCHGGLTGRPSDTLRRPDVVTAASRTQAVWDTKRHREREPANYSGGQVSALMEVDYVRNIQPLVNARCVSCHNSTTLAAGINLEGDDGWKALREFAEHREGSAIKSYLMEKLMGRELHATRSLVGDQPHPSDSPLEAAELLEFVRWIDLGAAFYAGTAP